MYFLTFNFAVSVDSQEVQGNTHLCSHLPYVNITHNCSTISKSILVQYTELIKISPVMYAFICVCCVYCVCVCVCVCVYVCVCIVLCNLVTGMALGSTSLALEGTRLRTHSTITDGSKKGCTMFTFIQT